MIDVADINVKIAIAFSLVIIAFTLVYYVFYKSPKSSKR